MSGPEREGGAGEPEVSVVGRLRRRYGVEVDPAVSLEASVRPDAPPASGGGATRTGVLGRLDLRRPVATRYRVDGELARGGMGAILDVWDEDLRRRLAMKVALDRRGEGSSAPAHEIDPRVLARFLEEAQVTGQLDHPGVVPVHELGLDAEGQVYFTMRLVRGRDLGQVFQLVPGGHEGWTTTRALGALLKACEALAYAHSKGVIHRDLKPANVMVGGFGEVYVMDWGLARVRGRADRHDLTLRDAPPAEWAVATDRREDASGGSGDELYTMDGDVVGTPSYMAPEQARGQLAALDERADVYSMGAMLYRLLAGTAPYVEAGARLGARTVLERVLAGPPEPLERLAPRTPPALAAICNKAMEREPDARYRDMTELAEDLRAFLEDRVVAAYRTGALAETRQWVRRNKPLAAALAAGVLALAGGLGAALVQKARADDNATLAEERRVDAVASAGLAEERRVQADEARGLAEERRQQADAARALAEERRVAADESAAEARRQSAIAREVNDFLNRDLLSAVRPEQGGKDVTVRQVLEEASLRLTGRFVEEPLVEAELRGTIGGTFASLGLHERARVELERALALQEAARAGEAETPGTEETLRQLGLAYLELGRLEDGRRALERARAICATALGADDVRTLTLDADLALQLSMAGRLEEAVAAYDRTLADHRRVLGERSGETLTVVNNLALALRDLGRFDEAEERLSEVLALRRARGEGRSRDALSTLNNLAVILLEQGRLEECAALNEEAYALAQDTLGPEHDQTAIAAANLGCVYVEQGRLEEAEPLLEEGLAGLARAGGTDQPERLRFLRAKARLLSETDRVEEALALDRELLADCERVLGPRHLDTLSTLNGLASELRALGRFDEARAAFEEAIARTTEVLGPDHPSTLVALENLGGLYYDFGRYERARELVLEVLDGRERALGPEHPDTAKTRHNLAHVELGLGHAEEAVALFEEALEPLRAGLGATHPLVVSLLRSLAGALADLGRDDEARARYGEVVELERERGEGDSIQTGFALHQRAWLSLRGGDAARAAAEAREAYEQRLRTLGAEHDYTRATTWLLAVCLQRAERFEEALPLARAFHEAALDRLGADDPQVSRARGLLAELYDALGRPEEAAAWR